MTLLVDQEGSRMPLFVTLMNWTDQGVKGFKTTVDRAEAARTALKAQGVTLKDVYWTIGPYDVVSVIDAPDPETLTAALLALGAQGNLRTTTLRAFTADEMRAVVAKAG
jgi:uncharacterized protein with GYD domain